MLVGPAIRVRTREACCRAVLERDRAKSQRAEALAWTGRGVKYFGPGVNGVACETGSGMGAGIDCRHPLCVRKPVEG